VGGLGLVFACVSTLVLIGSAISGFPIWAPPGFNINWRAFRAARHGRGGWDMAGCVRSVSVVGICRVS
jgi:hypothetical protein